MRNISRYIRRQLINCLNWYLVVLTMSLPLPILQAQDANRSTTLSKDADLDSVVVTATRFANPKLLIPQQVQIINKKEIEFRNSATSADLLETTGKAFVQRSQGGGGSPILRGLEANRVLLVVDGVRMNNAIFRGGHLQNVLRIDNNMLERVEVVYGAGAVTYGSDALGGVMHFQTRQPKLLLADDTRSLGVSGQLVARYGSANQEKMTAANISLSGKKWASLSSFSMTDFGNLRQGGNNNPFNKNYPDIFLRNEYVDHINGRDSVLLNKDPLEQKNTGYRQYSASQAFRFVPNTKWQHRLKFQFTTTGDVPRYDRLTDRRNGTLRFAEWYYGPETWLMANYQMQNFSRTKIADETRMTLAYQHFGESRHSRSLNNSLRKSQIEALDAVNVNLDVHKRINLSHSLSYGIEFWHNIVRSKAHFSDINTLEQTPSATRYPDGGSTMSGFSVYATDMLSWSPKWTLQGGLRYSNTGLKSEFIDQNFFPFPFNEVAQNANALSGNIGISYLPQQWYKLSLTAGNAYRVPNVDDMSKVFESTNGTLIVPNPKLQPEHAQTLDFSSVFKVNDQLKAELNVFYTRLSSVLTTEKSQFNGQDSLLFDDVMSAVYTTVNKDNAYITGGFVGFDAKLWRGLSFSGSMQYTFGRINTEANNTPLDHIPPLFGRVSLNYNSSNYRIELFSLFNAWKQIEDYRLNAEDNEVYATPDGMPAWYTLNMSASYSLKSVTFQARLDNILDTNYRSFASGVSASGRNASLTIRVNFGK